MAYTAEPRYTERVDAMVEPELAEYIQHRAQTEKVSKSSIVRELLDAGRAWIENARLLEGGE